jgi:hypothetical protein
MLFVARFEVKSFACIADAFDGYEHYWMVCDWRYDFVWIVVNRFLAFVQILPKFRTLFLFVGLAED